MHESLWTAGEASTSDAAPQWLTEVMNEGVGGAFEDPAPEASTMSVEVEAARHSFRVGEWEPLMRGAWRQGREVLIETPVHRASTCSCVRAAARSTSWPVGVHL